MSLLQRTIKLVLATVLSIAIANWLGLHYASSAGIIALLSVMDTRQSTMQIAWQRFLSVLLAFLIAIVLFSLLGYQLWVFGLYLLIFVPLSYRLQIQVGIAPISVLVLHLYAEQALSLALIGNELALFSIGASLALLLNSYMPSRLDEIMTYHEGVELKLKAILQKFQLFLEVGDGTNDAELINELELFLKKALDLVYLEQANQLFQSTNYHIHYFEMRQAQNRILKQMATSVKRLKVSSQEARLLAELFEQTAEQLSQDNPAVTLLADIDRTLATYRQMPLPNSREEFEYRALLFELLSELERFILLKVDFYQTYGKSSSK
ncbi:aromatic acid exporter family protein [Streptococcus loxodontisalivarius]|uniref:Uncharacterized membrane protein YgaE (UPF0421/DUF939 family) n=1 Tax=Streptococcus loxodontisalivarius TaxID=1349415 RepID=A0ABS2PQ53_9STRE|nr:aromatic acid exporter family protein [Streptococcus loxodontisalivarius]MBM7641830.1 uncharacterized membrane protein YgaE (UPF0421/DUF939 family) [Streptococcus loxodontisalivarius]